VKDPDLRKPVAPPSIGGWIGFCKIAAGIEAAGETSDLIILKRKESYASANRDAVAT
jgi:hypothetical protein